MQRKLQKHTVYVLTFGVLYLNSCRSTDTDDTLAGTGTAMVDINFLGTDFSDSLPLQASASKDKPGGIPNETMQRHTLLLDPSTVVISEITPVLEPLKNSARTLNGAIAAVDGNPLVTGDKFRIIAYKQSDKKYKSYKDYTVGLPADPIMLDSNVAYDIIAYSYGKTLPPIDPKEQTDLNSATIDYDNTGRDLDFMYQKTSITPNKTGSNVLNIKLRHKLTLLQSVTFRSYMGNINSISGNPLLGSHYTKGTFPLNTGIMIGRSNPTNIQLTFTKTDNTTWSATAPSFPMYINGAGKGTGSFSATVNFNNIFNNNAAEDKVINLPNSFNLTPETRKELTFTLAKCGAYLGPNQTLWRDFMCHNLGADYSADPFTPSAAIHGAKYQWGAQTNETGRYISQSYDQSNSGVIPGWKSYVTPKPNGSWSDTNKTANDPCPSGYRVPTQAQWQAVIDNNDNVEGVGSWNDGNYTSALYFRNSSNIRTLMLPTAGRRFATDGLLYSRGNLAYYWSSSIFTSNAQILFFYNTGVNVGKFDRTNGIPVRCIAE
ncbi:TPA: FISUMP domain-containing protein [Elizabethkingia anophelis]